ncbi:MAG: 4-hydroxythreonine-4-phosphate dehydrogenase PdxA [Chloroflexi bacterium]|nr:4-hydroxythreonine-4-phosphate dehydrogenase PdxA [Chloroflexota bacterium]
MTSTTETKPVLAITMGDPGGIGPEIIAKALTHADVYDHSRPLVIGERRAMEAAVRITGRPLEVRLVDQPADAGDHPGTIDLVDLANIDIEQLGRARVCPEVGKAAYDYLELATHLALDNQVGAIVTAPLNKEALSEAGWVGIGHTELLARFAGVPDKNVAMMLASNRLRVVHVSTHVSLRRAIELVSPERIMTATRLAGETARDIVGREPHIAVAGLNPHAGEHGLFGSEEEELIEPAIEQLRAEGWHVSGPVSPDTVFLRAASGDFDAVIAMYHDQGHIPSKFAGFDDTVNVTLGLPIVRTSVDHGTAYDIAGTGKANEANMLAAIELAAQMAANRERRLTEDSRSRPAR